MLTIEKNDQLNQMFDQAREDVASLVRDANDRADAGAVGHVAPARWGERSRALAAHGDALAVVYGCAAAAVVALALAGHVPLLVALGAAVCSMLVVVPATRALSESLAARYVLVHEPQVIAMFGFVRDAQQAARSTRTRMGRVLARELARLEREMSGLVAPMVRAEFASTTLSEVFVGGPVRVSVASFGSRDGYATVQQLRESCVYAMTAMQVLELAARRRVTVPSVMLTPRSARSRIASVARSAVS